MDKDTTPKPDSRKRKAESQSTTPYSFGRNTKPKRDYKQDANEFTDEEMEAKRKGRKKLTIGEKAEVAKGIASLDDRNKRIAGEIVRRGVASLRVGSLSHLRETGVDVEIGCGGQGNCGGC